MLYTLSYILQWIFVALPIAILILHFTIQMSMYAFWSFLAFAQVSYYLRFYISNTPASLAIWYD